MIFVDIEENAGTHRHEATPIPAEMKGFTVFRRQKRII